jgi:hypothetical protein
MPDTWFIGELCLPGSPDDRIIAILSEYGKQKQQNTKRVVLMLSNIAKKA